MINKGSCNRVENGEKLHQSRLINLAYAGRRAQDRWPSRIGRKKASARTFNVNFSQDEPPLRALVHHGIKRTKAKIPDDLEIP